MFLENKYSRTYQRLVDAARSRPLPDRSKAGRKAAYFEEHHVHPKALGGADTPENFVYFTAKEHFIAHLLLPKMTEGSARAKMQSALSKMLMVPKKMKGLRYVPTGRTFEIAKKASAEAHRGNKEIGAKISAARTGQKASPETRALLSAQRLGRKLNLTDEQRKIRSDHQPKVKSDQARARMVEAWVARRARKAAGLEARAAYTPEAIQNFKIAAQLRERKKQEVVKFFAFGLDCKYTNTKGSR